jgi:hypothetical protein
MTFLQHTKAVFCLAFRQFGLARDMALGAIIAALSIMLQAKWGLISTQDWQSHKWRWIASVILPFVGVLLVDSLLRIARAPWLLHREQESRHDETRKELERSKTECAAYRSTLERRGPKLWLEWGGSTNLSQRTLGITNLDGGPATNIQLEEMTDGKLFSKKSALIPLLTVGNTNWLTLEVRAVGEMDFGPFSIESLIVKAEKPIIARVYHEDGNGTRYETVFEITPDRNAWTAISKQIDRRLC